MREIIRSNEPVFLSYVQDLLAQSGITSFLFDQHAAMVDGSMPFVEQRIMVADDDWAKAAELLQDVELPE